jgi:hypothetical protein
MAFALLSRSRSKTQGSVKFVPKGKSARGQHPADSRFGFGKPVFQPPTAALPTVPVIQAKLKIGESNDKFEEEADRFADAVTRMSDPRKTDDAEMAPHEHHAPQRVSRVAISQPAAPTPSPGPDVPPIVHEVLHSPGQPLDPATRAFMETRFGYDFSQVRVHGDVKAAESARSVDAQAYTVGRDVVFSEGGYTPHSRQGSQLLAHELAHVIQQERGGASPPPIRGGMLEQDASAAASALVAGHGPIHVSGASGPGLARQPLPRTEPRSLKESLFALTDAELEEEIQLIVEWLIRHPADSFDRTHLSLELDRLEAVRWQRSERAGRRQKYLEDLARVVHAVNEGRIPKWMKVFPFRPSRGPIRGDVAPIFAWREGDSIVVHQPQNAVANTDRFKKDVKTLPGDVFSKSGHALRPNELVGVRLYDEGGKVAVCYATDLLELSEASHTAMLVNIAAVGLSVVGGPLVGRLVGRALAALAKPLTALAKPLGAAAQRGLFYTKLSIGSAGAGAAEAAPTALGGIASRTSVTLVEGRASAAVAQQAIGQSTVRAGVETAAVQSTARLGQAAASTVSPSLGGLATTGGVIGTNVTGAAVSSVTGPSFADVTAQLGLEAPGTVRYRSTAAAAAAARASGLETPTRPGFQTHSTAPTVRRAFGVTGSEFESAHIVFQALYRRLRQSAGRALTTLLPRAAHRAFDSGWVSAWNAAIAAGMQIRAIDVYSMVVGALRAVNPNLINNATKGAIEDRLRQELFQELGLRPWDIVVPARLGP